MKNIVILISGRGPTWRRSCALCASEGWNARIRRGGDNRPDAAGLAFAQTHGIATAVVDHKTFAHVRLRRKLATAIEGFSPDVLALAGFMRILSPAIRQAFRASNGQHPPVAASVVHRAAHAPRAIEAGCKLAGPPSTL